MALLNFNAQTVAPAQAFELLPAGWYNAKIVESQMKPTKNGSGAYLALTLEVIDDKYASRKLFDRLNLKNDNPQAVDIAYRTLSAICHATGIVQVQDSAQLHGIPLQVKVKVVPAKDGYEASNEISGYKPIESAPSQQAFAFAPSPAQTPAAPHVASPAQPPMAPPVIPAETTSAPSSIPPWARA